MAEETQYLGIDNQLRFVLFGLECSLDVEFDPSVVEQVFSDSEVDSISEKRYNFWIGPGVEVTGYVEEYEPNDLWLTVRSRQRYNPSLSIISERAQYQVLRWAKWQETHKHEAF